MTILEGSSLKKSLQIFEHYFKSILKIQPSEPIKSTSSAKEVLIGPSRQDALHTPYHPWRMFTHDGLALAGRDYAPHKTSLPPLLCIPGLSRNSRDFEPFAQRFSSTRRVLTMDLRGRGLSEYDSHPQNYNLFIEAHDTLRFLDKLELEKPILIGTSRGGLLAILMSSLRPQPFKGVILNDIGPVIELEGLLKIRSYLNKKVYPNNWEEASEFIAEHTRKTFPNLTSDAHNRMARQIFRSLGDTLFPDYDLNLNATMTSLNLSSPLPSLWTEFSTLKMCPLLLLRGEHSDILSSTTVEQMKTAHPNLEFHEVQGEGHAPLLQDDLTLDRIACFLEKIRA